jgi:hypothetical protein
MPTQAKRGGRGTASKPLATSTIEELMPYAKDTGWDSGPVWMGTENLTPIGIASPDHSAHIRSPYQLHHPSTLGGSLFHPYLYHIKITFQITVTDVKALMCVKRSHNLIWLSRNAKGFLFCLKAPQVNLPISCSA